MCYNDYRNIQESEIMYQYAKIERKTGKLETGNKRKKRRVQKRSAQTVPVYWREEWHAVDEDGGPIQLRALSYWQEEQKLLQVSPNGDVIQRLIYVDGNRTVTELIGPVLGVLKSRGFKPDSSKIKQELNNIDSLNGNQKPSFDSIDMLADEIQKRLGLGEEGQGMVPLEHTETSEDSTRPVPFSKPVKLTNDRIIFMPYAKKTYVLYRSMSEEEYEELDSVISAEKKVRFQHGTKQGKGEKFFAPNLRYLYGNMDRKGNRVITVKIELHPSVLKELLFNPTIAGVEKNTLRDLNLQSRGLKRVKKTNSIIIKGESHAHNYSQNFGFRKDASLTSLSEYIISIRKLSDKDYTNLDMRKRVTGYIDDLGDDGRQMEIDGDLFKIDGREYNVAGNQGFDQKCFWRLLRNGGIGEVELQNAAIAAHIEYNAPVEVGTLREFIDCLNKQFEEAKRITLHLDIFSYSGEYLEEFETGNGPVRFDIGLVIDPEGNGHYIMREPELPQVF